MIQRAIRTATRIARNPAAIDCGGPQQSSALSGYVFDVRRSDTHDDTASDTAGEGPRLTGVIRASRSEVRVTFSPREAGQAKGWRSGGKSRGAGSCCESWTPSVRKGCLLKQPGLDRLRSIHAPSRLGGMTNGNGDHVRAAAARPGNTAALRYSERYVLRYSRVACPPQEPARTGRVTGTSREGGFPLPDLLDGIRQRGQRRSAGWRRNLLNASRCGARARGHHPPWPTRGFRLIRPGWKWGTGVGGKAQLECRPVECRPGGRNPG